ncbi:hypothetical protein, partial [Streptomyces sp. FH025]|uniref:hypothetical protein n=1 Tax=Streptomyces sp. FH025 TaxID=2815937 RepID=UPI001A9F0821
VALVAGVLLSLPLGRKVAGGRRAVAGAFLVLFLVVVEATVFTAAQATDTVRTRLHEPRGVEATVTHCHVTGRLAGENGTLGDPTYGCTYRWSVDGREFSEERPVREPHPDGWQTRVWLSGDRMDTGRPSVLSVPLWGALAVLGLIASVRLAGAAAEDARAAGLWRRS